ncbi:MAG: glycosyltransferase [Balneolaceae bacterium]|nr:glycosyltransferase [Balneolaceae bacterium]
MKVALFIPTLDGGGAQRVVLNLAEGLVGLGIEVDLILVKKKGDLLSQIPAGVRLVNLGKNRTLTSLLSLIKLVRKKRYSALITFMNYVNTSVLLTKPFLPKETKLVITEHNTLSTKLDGGGVKVSQKVKLYLMKILYPKADKMVAVSGGVAENVSLTIGIENQFEIIYNPIVNQKLKEITKADNRVAFPWDHNQEPVIIGVGRLTRQKNFRNLIEAFHIVNRDVPSRLAIFGEGELREDLEILVTQLNLQHRVWMPGFVDNVYDYMKASDLFVLSSSWEGFGNVLVEAMACGVPVISTDCPSGPSEILENGKWGGLAENDNVNSLAETMLRSLSMKQERLLNKRVSDFDVNKIANKYLDLLK